MILIKNAETLKYEEKDVGLKFSVKKTLNTVVEREGRVFSWYFAILSIVQQFKYLADLVTASNDTKYVMVWGGVHSWDGGRIVKLSQ